MTTYYIKAGQLANETVFLYFFQLRSNFFTEIKGYEYPQNDKSKVYRPREKLETKLKK